MPLFHSKRNSSTPEADPKHAATATTDSVPISASEGTSMFSRLRSRSRSKDRGDGKAAGHRSSSSGAHGAVEQVDSGGSGTGSASTEVIDRTRSHSRSKEREGASKNRSREGSQSRKHDKSSHPEEKHHNETQQEGDALSKDDVRALFSGAPHFTLEPGHRGRSFPQAFYPFAVDLDLTDLHDHINITHESFALATLHSHLPVPVSHLAKRRQSSSTTGGISTTETESPMTREVFSPTTAGAAPTTYFHGATSDPHAEAHEGITAPDVDSGLGTGHRPMIDMGIYERPNMISLHGTEPGTFGFHAFLERGVADGLDSTTAISDTISDHAPSFAAAGADAYSSAKADVEASASAGDGSKLVRNPSNSKAGDFEHQSATEALRALAIARPEKNKIGRHAKPYDRVALLREGPHAWTKLGVRPMGMRTITERLEKASALREEVVKHGWKYTALQAEGWGEKEMGRYLFEELLFDQPDSHSSVDAAARDKFLVSGGGSAEHEKGHSLKHQIEVLVKILSTPGAWLDFSLPRERLLFALGLRTREVKEEVDQRGIKTSSKQWMNLVQLLLASELVIRLDAALRTGVARHSDEIDVSAVEIHRFNKRRTLKVDWDMVVAKRFLGLCYAKRMPTAGLCPGVHTAREQESAKKGSTFRLFGRFKGHDAAKNTPEEEWEYDLAILPRKPAIMADGLERFAEDIGWDPAAIAHIKTEIARKLCNKPKHEQEGILAHGVEPIEHPHVAQHTRDRSRVEVRAAGHDTLGGPLTHAWLGGLIIPGYNSCDILMCALLENDTQQRAVERLGNIAYPRTGFVLGSRSWWSKVCIVSSVFAPALGSKERMGWVGLPEGLSPIDAQTEETMKDGWRLVVSKWGSRVMKRDVGRIHDGDQLGKESSTLGVGKGLVLAREFNLVTDWELDKAVAAKKVEVGDLKLVLQEKEFESEKPETDGTPFYEAGALVSMREGANAEGKAVTVHLPLKWTIRFIAQHPCRPPHGHTRPPPATTSSASEERQPPTALKHKHAEHLPAHLLHHSFHFVAKSIPEILSITAEDDESLLPDPTSKGSDSPVWVVDARGGWQREVLVRAWCANVGLHAVISRVGKGCIGCAVREARACEVAVVVRVGR